MDDYATTLRPRRRKKKEKSFNFAYVLILWLVCLLVLNFFLYFNKKRSDYKTKQKEIVTLNKEIEDLKQKKSSLEREITYMKSDKGVEDTARQKLGLVKKGEIAVIVLKDKNVKPGADANNINNNNSNNEANKKMAPGAKPNTLIDKILKFLHIR